MTGDYLELTAPRLRAFAVVLALLASGCAPERIPDAIGPSDRTMGVKLRDGDGRCVYLQLTAGQYQSLYVTPLDDQACVGAKP